jgi:hypothetical protein
MKQFLLLTVLSGLVLAGVPARAAVVWNSGVDTVSSGDNLVFGIAEQFFLTSPTTLTDLRFYQGEFAVSPDINDSFDIRISADASGQPGSSLFFEFTSTYTKTLFGSTTIAGNAYNSYLIDTALTPGWLPAGTYWLGLTSVNISPYWDVSNGPCGATCPDGTVPGILQPGPSQSTHNFEYAFELSGTGAPEPGTAGLFLSAGLAGLLMYRRRS